MCKGSANLFVNKIFSSFCRLFIVLFHDNCLFLSFASLFFPYFNRHPLA